MLTTNYPNLDDLTIWRVTINPFMMEADIIGLVSIS